MPKKAREPSALEVGRLKVPGRYPVGGVAGFHLKIAPSGARSWVLRVVIAGKRRDAGLRGFPDVPLALAREVARRARNEIEQETDPIAQRASALSAMIAARGAETTFEQASAKFFEPMHMNGLMRSMLRNGFQLFLLYSFPIIGKLQVRDVTLAHVAKILDPICTTKTETATRLRGRIENVLDRATVRGYRQGDNPARRKGHLDKILPKPRKVAKVEHHAAVPIEQIGAFVTALR